MDKAANGLFSPRDAPLGFFPLWDAGSIIPSEGTSETANKEEDIVNDDKHANEGDPHYSQARGEN